MEEVQLSPSQKSAELFKEAHKKQREDLTEEELRAIITCYGWLDDDERKKFAISRADLNEVELQNYRKILLLDIYFPEV